MENKRKYSQVTLMVKPIREPMMRYLLISQIYSTKNIKSLGLTLEQYLGSTNKTPEKLREDFAEKAQNDIKIEFVLAKIAETEKITVEEKEIEEAIHTAKTDAERANLEQNRHLLSSIIRQQKTLDFLRNL
jgi:trigger factor